jgi:broad specificity phosphatase PhoE
MTKYLALLLLSLASVLVSPMADAQRALFVTRHAERLDDSADSPLSNAGEARAQALATNLRDAGITAIYTTDFQRTKQTAEPLARALKITPVSVRGSDVPGLFRRLQEENRNDVVLVVGHNTSVPPLLKLFGYPIDLKIAITEFDNLFVVVPKEGSAPTLLRIRY